MGCTAEKYCVLHVVVQGPGSFPGPVDCSVRRTVAELRGVKLAQFRILAFVGCTCPPASALLVLFIFNLYCFSTIGLRYDTIR